METIPLTRKAIAPLKRRNKIPTSGGDIPEDIVNAFHDHTRNQNYKC